MQVFEDNHLIDCAGTEFLNFGLYLPIKDIATSTICLSFQPFGFALVVAGFRLIAGGIVSKYLTADPTINSAFILGVDTSEYTRAFSCFEKSLFSTKVKEFNADDGVN